VSVISVNSCIRIYVCEVFCVYFTCLCTYIPSCCVLLLVLFYPQRRFRLSVGRNKILKNLNAFSECSFPINMLGSGSRYVLYIDIYLGFEVLLLHRIL
jgi:hypothetical protein